VFEPILSLSVVVEHVNEQWLCSDPVACLVSSGTKPPRRFIPGVVIQGSSLYLGPEIDVAIRRSSD